MSRLKTLLSAGGAGSARVTATPGEKLLAPNLAALCIKAGINPGERGADPDVRRVARAPLAHFAKASLDAYGIHTNPYEAESILEAALEMDGPGRFAIGADGGIPYSRPGSFPNLLSGLAEKAFDEGVEQAEVAYEEWTGVKVNDLPDFKPVPIVAKGKYGELDEVLDAEEFKEQKLNEECLSQIQLARFGNSFALTPVMGANDDLEAFAENLIGLSEGWELKQNRGCLSLVTGNAYLLDGFQLYDDANHANHIASGGNPPSDSEWDAMEVKLASQTTIGNTAYTNASLAIALVPPARWRAAVQAFQTPRDGWEEKAAATDTNINVYRGLVKVVKEKELTATSSVEWYAFADPTRFRNATVIRAYFRGFPRLGKRERWYDPRTKCMYFSLEGRAGFAVKNYRTTIKNKGAA